MVSVVMFFFVKIETVGTLEAKTHLSSLLDKVQKGDVILITKHGKVIAELKGVNEEKKTPKAGFAKDFFGKTSSDFNDPLEDFAEYMS